jgi:hypothetical protein
MRQPTTTSALGWLRKIEASDLHPSLFAQPLFVTVNACRGAKLHAPIVPDVESELLTAVIASHERAPLPLTINARILNTVPLRQQRQISVSVAQSNPDMGDNADSDEVARV